MRSSAMRLVYVAMILAALLKNVQGQYTRADGTILDGTYTLFNVSKLYFSRRNPTIFHSSSKIVCPSSIDFQISASSRVSFPGGLKDTTGNCKPISGFKNTSNRLSDFGASISTFLGENPPTYLKNDPLYKLVKVPNGTLVCPGIPKGSHTFRELSLSWLTERMIAKVTVAAIKMKIPAVIFEKVFGNFRFMARWTRGDHPKGWDDQFLNITTWGLRAELAKIKNITTIYLYADAGFGLPRTGMEYDCLYARAPVEITISDISHTIDKFTEKFMLFMLQFTQKAVELAGTSFYVADSRCDSSKADSIGEISFPKTTPTLYPVSSIEVKGVSIDGKACATATKMARLSEIETFITDTKSDAIGKKIVAFFKNNTGFNIKAGLLTDYVLDEENMLEPEGFADRMDKATTKIAIIHANIDVSKCDHMKDKSTLSVFIVQKYSAAGYFCNKFGGAPMPAKGCDANSALQASHSALVVRDTADIPECIFSSDKTIADQFKVVGKTSPSPPPKNSSVDPGTPVDPKRNADRPIPGSKNNTKASKTCFPASSRVLLSNGRFSAMKDLCVGDSIQVAPGVFEPVLMFTHATPSIRSDMVVVESTSGAELVASPGHLVYLNGRVAETKQAKVGDTIMVEQDGMLVAEIVTSVKVEQMNGLYNPQTPSGNILVHHGRGPDTSAVLATTYTAVVPYTAAHSLLAPIRFIQSWFGTFIPAMSQLFPETKNVHPQRHLEPL